LAAAIPVVAIADSLREHFLNRNRYERIVETFQVFKSEIEAMEKECAGDRERLDAIYNYTKSPEFAEAVVAAAEEAARSTNTKKIKRLAVALANSCDPSIEPSDSDDLTLALDEKKTAGTDARKDHAGLIDCPAASRSF